jgi:hypothetical protein
MSSKRALPKPKRETAWWNKRNQARMTKQEEYAAAAEAQRAEAEAADALLGSPEASA